MLCDVKQNNKTVPSLKALEAIQKHLGFAFGCFFFFFPVALENLNPKNRDYF